MSKKIIGVTVGTPIRPTKLATDLGDRLMDIMQAKPVQEKTVDITENGATEIFPDEGYVLSKVTANVNVPTASGENKFTQLVVGTLTEITAEDLQGVTKIGKHAFSHYPITNIEFPLTLQIIGESAFYNCEKLNTHITIPNSVTTICDGAFNYCVRIPSVTIGRGVTTIGASAFGSTYELKDVYYEGDIVSWCNITMGGSGSWNYTNPLSYAEAKFYIKNKSGEYEIVENLIIPDTVTQINHDTFKRCSSIKNLIISNSVTTISDYAFNDCRNLTSARIGNGITSLSSTAFKECVALTDIYIDKAEGSIEGAPWGATNATVHWNTPLPSEEV